MVRIATFLLLVPLGLQAQPASPIADIFCDERAAMVMKLERDFGAERQGGGMRGPDAVIEIWMVPSTGAWTLVQSYAGGHACIVAMGENWEDFASARDPA